MSDDTISRQAAIDAFYDAFCYAYCDNCEKEMNEDLCGDCHRKYQNWSASKKIIEKVINNLPSAQPELATDCISRQAAIDSCHNYEDGKDAYAYSYVVEERLKTLPSAQRWIPCSERLPEEYGEYLITWETSKAPSRFIGFAEGEETGVWDDQHDRFVFSWLPEDYIIERYPDWRVIAWMPLPEPYKGEQE